jgi:hypothetical protein
MAGCAADVALCPVSVTARNNIEYCACLCVCVCVVHMRVVASLADAKVGVVDCAWLYIYGYCTVSTNVL